MPKRPATVEAIPDSDARSARQTCEDAGAEGEEVLANCILDVYCSGDSGYADEHAGRQEPPASAEVERPILVDEWFHVGDGKWKVAGDGRTVLQKTNPFWGVGRDNFPGMYIRGQEHFDTTIPGTFEVTTDSDNDWIGFVFGHRRPVEDDPGSH